MSSIYNVYNVSDTDAAQWVAQYEIRRDVIEFLRREWDTTDITEIDNGQFFIKNFNGSFVIAPDTFFSYEDRVIVPTYPIQRIKDYYTFAELDSMNEYEVSYRTIENIKEYWCNRDEAEDWYTNLINVGMPEGVHVNIYNPYYSGYAYELQSIEFTPAGFYELCINLFEENPLKYFMSKNDNSTWFAVSYCNDTLLEIHEDLKKRLPVDYDYIESYLMRVLDHLDHTLNELSFYQPYEQYCVEERLLNDDETLYTIDGIPEDKVYTC